MNNLIITIICFALIAVAAIMGIYYAGIAFENAQFNAIANSIINEANQILLAEREWATNNNQPDVGGMPGAFVTPNGATSLNSDNSGIGLLVSSNLLSEWPSLAGNISQPSPNNGSTLTSGSDFGCYSISGYNGLIIRRLVAYKGGNYVVYQFGINIPYDGVCTDTNGVFSASTTDTSEAGHPIVMIAKAINNSLNQISNDADMSTVTYLGIPKTPVSATTPGAVSIDVNGVLQTNYCYLFSSGSGIACMFGPS